MSRFHYDNIRIAGIAAAVPEKKFLTTEHANEVFDVETLEKFEKTTGVKSTYRTHKKQTASDLCFAAAKKLMEERGIERETIGACVFVSQTADYRLPATAFVLQERLGLGRDCTCFDINLGCSGYVIGLSAVAALMQNSNIERALLLVGDTCYKTDSDKDINHCLFGDAGAATLLEKDETAEPIETEIMSDGSGFRSIIMPCGGYRNIEGETERIEREDGYYRSDYDGYLDGTEVFAFSIREAPRAVKRMLEAQGKTVDDFDGVVLHQANEMIIKQIAKKLKAPTERVPLTLDRYGNTSSVSIPLTIADVWNKDCGKPSVSFVACGFGVGLSWATMTAKLDTGVVSPIFQTSEFFEDGVLKYD